LLAFFHSPHNAKGHLTLDLDLQGTGVSADQLLSHLDGTLRMDGKDLEILDTDLDAVLTHMENSQGVGLLDIGAYALLGPAGVLLTKGTEYSALLGSVIQRGKSRVTAMHSALRIESGVVHTEDVAIATPKHRLAVKGTLDLRDQGRAALQIATVDAQGCANYVETLAGSGRSPQVNHAGMVINSVLNPVNSVLDTVVRTLTGGCSKPFYQGQVAAL